MDAEVLKSKFIASMPKIGIAAGILILGVISLKIARRALKKFEEKTTAKINPLVFSYVDKCIVYIVGAVTAILALKEVGLDAEKVIVALLIVLLAYPVSGLVKIFMQIFEEEIIKKSKSKAGVAVFPLINKTVSFSIYIFAVILALNNLGFQVLPFLAGMGIVGLAIGLAAKDTLSNMIAGIFIVIDRPFEVGDRIEVWNAPKNTSSWGDVIEIGLRSTKIRTTDNLVMIIPNSSITSRDVTNYTAMSPEIRIRIPVGIAYEADLDKAEKILLATAESTQGVLKEPKPRVILRKFGDSSIELELGVWIEDARIKTRIESEIGKKIKKEFDRNKIEIPYPKRHVILDKSAKNI